MCGSANRQSLPSNRDPPDPCIGSQDGHMGGTAIEPPDLVVNILIPNDIQSIIRMISQAYLTTLPSVLVLLEDRIPNFAPDSLPIACMGLMQVDLMGEYGSTRNL